MNENSVNSEGSVQWAAPREFRSVVAGPPLPLDAFPESLRGYIKSVAEVHQVPSDLAVGATLGTLAAAAAGKASVAVGETHHEPLNLYVMVILPSGERKSQGIRMMAAELWEEEKRLEDQGSGQQLVIDDATPEFVAKALEQSHGRIAIVSEEAGSIVAAMAGQRYGKNSVPDLDVYLKAYDGGKIRVGRISRDPVNVESPALTVLVTPQPSVLDKMAEVEDFRDRGLVGRVAFLLPESLVGTREYKNQPIDQPAKADYERSIRSLLQLPLPAEDHPPSLSLEGGALDDWADFADDIEKRQADGGDLEECRDYASKLAGRVARIAGLFHLVRYRENKAPWSVPIDREDVLAAWAVGETLLAHALVVFDRVGANPNQEEAEKALRWIRRKKLTAFSLRELHQVRRKLRPGSDEQTAALNVLQRHGFIRPLPDKVDRKGSGRPPSPRFEVNPLTHAQKAQNPQNAPEGAPLELGSGDAHP